MSRNYKLHGFNNLTKTLNLNFYNINYVDNKSLEKQYSEYINHKYNANKLTDILRNVTDMIGANILNIAKQDYEPQGASASFLISEGAIPIVIIDDSCNKGNIIPSNKHIVGHLDKSHITVHTYPEKNVDNNIFVIRIDIEISTCGEISPLESINYLIEKFNSDIISIDYRVRGFSRDIDGKKHYIDHNITSIQDYILDRNKNNYIVKDYNLPSNNIFFSKMMIGHFEVDKHLFELNKQELKHNKIENISKKINNEMNEIFNCKK